jgi:lysophospholipase L1-like esterase
VSLVACAGVESERRVGRAAPRSPSTSETAPTAAVKRVARKAADEPVGHLEHPARLAALFARLHEIETRQARADVRLVQFGDSHTASDYGTSVARARLAERFGDGGRGFIPMGRPHRRLFQAGEAMARGVGFEPEEASLSGSHTRPDGFFGPTGIAMNARAAGASMASELTASADHFEVAYLAQPGGGSFDVSIDGQRKGRVTTARASRASAFETFAVARGAHNLEVRAVGDGAVRIFGVRLDDEAVGITLDAFGINGAKATTPLASDESHFAEQMARIAPALAIIAYGTNEAGDSTTTPDEHAAAIRTLVERVRRSAPEAECVVLGPPDRDTKKQGGVHTMTKLVDLLAAQRRAASDAGCAFYDQFTAMGATDAIGRWANESPPRARRDLVHLTRAGYAFLAEALVRDLLAAYDTWKSETISTRP